jgi:hypothetical protein
MLLQGGQSVAGHRIPGCARPVPRRDAQSGRLLLCASRDQARQPGGRRRGHGSNLLRAGGPHLTLHRVFRQLQVREPCLCPGPYFDSIDTPFMHRSSFYPSLAFPPSPLIFQFTFFLLLIPSSSWLFLSGFRIRIHFLRIRIRIQRIRMEANTDTDPDPAPDPIRIQGFNDQKLKKNNS